MDRLDVELYAERLARLAAQAADDLADARLRLAWCALEEAAAAALAPDDAERLRTIGVLVGADRASLERAVRELALDLAALARLQAHVEAARVAVRQAGVTATRRPPSSS